MNRPRLTFTNAMALALSACDSPEANRQRGGGPGADVGNRRGNIEMHAGSKLYWKTPKLIGAKNPPLEAAQQASEGNRR